jgi:hypothetical protein
MLDAKTVSQAIRLAITGAAFSLLPLANAEASTTMYNLYGSSSSPLSADYQTDGWLWGPDTPSSNNPNAAVPGWKGTNGPTTTPFSVTGGMAINWAAHLTNSGDQLTISQADAFSRFGIYADIDTSSGAWRDPSNGRGTRHSIEIGLFKSDVNQTINLSISGINNPAANFGITIYQGAAQNLEINHYGYLFFNSSVDYLDYSETFTNTVGNTTTTTTNTYYLPYIIRTALDPNTNLTNNNLSFQAEAGVLYTIMLGGNGGQFYDGYDGYQLKISSVPLPSSLWLFVTTISGLLGLQRRKSLSLTCGNKI